jgi:hypothetical protein
MAQYYFFTKVVLGRQPFERVFLQKLSRLYEILKNFDNFLRSNFMLLLTQTLSTSRTARREFESYTCCVDCAERALTLYGIGLIPSWFVFLHL